MFILFWYIFLYVILHGFYFFPPFRQECFFSRRRKPQQQLSPATRHNFTFAGKIPKGQRLKMGDGCNKKREKVSVKEFSSLMLCEFIWKLFKLLFTLQEPSGSKKKITQKMMILVEKKTGGRNLCQLFLMIFPKPLSPFFYFFFMKKSTISTLEAAIHIIKLKDGKVKTLFTMTFMNHQALFINTRQRPLGLFPSRKLFNFDTIFFYWYFSSFLRKLIWDNTNLFFSNIHYPFSCNIMLQYVAFINLERKYL